LPVAKAAPDFAHAHPGYERPATAYLQVLT
jgi:hypothetical protein